MRRTLAALLAIVALAGGAASCSSSAGPGTGSTASTGSAVPASSTDVSFVVDGTTTYGTLEVPAHRSGVRLAAALLIPGSGPTDRDGNDTKLGLTAATLRLVADRLATQGIMTFRYDKYFSGRTGGGRYGSDASTITITQFFVQAAAAYDFLARQPQADRSKLLVVGHSEGGMIALSVAGSVSPRPAGLALLEPQDLRILDLIRLQVNEAIDGLVRQGVLTDVRGRTNATLVAQAIAAFRAGQPVNLEAMAPQVAQLVAPELTGQNVTFVRSNDAVVPARLAAKVAGGTRVLVTAGTRDTNVPPRTTGPLMSALDAAGVTGPKLTRLRGVDHLLHLPGQADTQAVLAPAFVTALTGWAAPYASAR